MDSRIVDFLNSKNVKVITDDTPNQIEVWKQWYRGEVDGFHKYYLYNGSNKVPARRLSLNMGETVAQNWADLALNEKVKFNCDDEYTLQVLNGLLTQTNFYVKGNNLIESAFALGGGFFIQYWDGERVSQKYVTQDFAYPIAYNCEGITECAFGSERTVANKKLLYVEVHTRNEQGYYTIDNYLLEENKKSIKEVPQSFYDQNNISQKVETNRTTPSFQFVRPNICNKLNLDSPFGVSVYAGATDCLKACDMTFDGYYKEIYLGRKRIFVKDGVTKFNIDPKTGEQSQVFDAEDEVFYKVPDDDEGNPITECNMSLRINEFDTAMQSQLNILSQKCGFGNNHFKWDNGNVSTATQIISENSDMYRTLKKHEILIRQAVVDMAKSLLWYEAIFNEDDQINLDATITVDFDDSIIEDTAEIKRQALTDYNAGLISKAEYFRLIYKYDDEQAKKYVEKMAEERNAEMQLEVVEEEPAME